MVPNACARACTARFDYITACITGGAVAPVWSLVLFHRPDGAIEGDRERAEIPIVDAFWDLP